MSDRKTILVIDDEDAICLAFRRFFEARGWRTFVAASANQGLLVYRQNHPDVVFLDIRLPDGNGLDLLTDLQNDASVIVITAFSSLETTVSALRGLAFDYLVKPLDLDKALALAERALESKRDKRADTTQSMSDDSRVLIGDSPAMQEIYKLIARAADADAPVLITGATGTGKELAARAIHGFSRRKDRPLVAVNCGALPEALVESELFGATRGAFTGADTDRAGRFELAHGGTLLLDEIGELPLSAQVKLLRVLDSQEVERIGGTRSTRVDARIIAASNRNLGMEVQAGRFRADLYYRLAVFGIELPLLRDRPQDIMPLANHFLGRRPRMSPAVADVLMKHDWPGNVRELRNAVEAAAMIAPGRVIEPEDLPGSVRFKANHGSANQDDLRRSVVDWLAGMGDRGDARYDRMIEQVERTAIEYAMKQSNGRQNEAANYLGVHRNTLRNRIRELQLGELKESD